MLRRSGGWLSQISNVGCHKSKQVACSLEIRFTGDDFEPDSGYKKCDFSLVTKGSTTVNVDTIVVLGLQSSDGKYDSDKEVGVVVRRGTTSHYSFGLRKKVLCCRCHTNGINVRWYLVQRCMQDKFSFIQSPIRGREHL